MLRTAVWVVFALGALVSDGLAAGCYDFDDVDALARGAVRGENVPVPVDGFDLLLMRDSVAELLTRQTPFDVPIAGSPVDSADYGVGIWLDQRDQDGVLLGALAAGARGFSAWIDIDDRMVGVFATDRTRSGNVRELVDLIRDAAEIAVRNPQPCPPRRAGGRVLP